MPIPFVQDHFKLRLPINWYPATDQEKGVILWSRPGITLLHDLGPDACRFSKLSSNGNGYVIQGVDVYEVSPSLTYTKIGSVGPLVGDCYMSTSMYDVMWVVGSNAYAYKITTGVFTDITSMLPCTPSCMTYQDTYFIIGEAGTNKYFISDDPYTWDAADYGIKTSSADPNVAIVSHNEQLYLMGSQTVEPWYNSGSGLFPFTRVEAAKIEIGILAPLTLLEVDGSLVFLSNRGQLNQMKGYAPQIISNRRLEKDWEAFGDLSTAKALTYVYQGHWFYQINFPDADKSYAYDVATKAWHELTTQDHRHVAECYLKIGNKHVIGDYRKGTLYELDGTAFTDDGVEITRVLETVAIDQKGRKGFFSKVQAEWSDSGYVPPSGAGSNPQAMMRCSNDGGNTWGSEDWQGMGLIGETTRRCIWRQKGSSRRRVFEITVTDPAIANMIDLFIDVKWGTS
jgi:hypothetical protein